MITDTKFDFQMTLNGATYGVVVDVDAYAPVGTWVRHHRTLRVERRRHGRAYVWGTPDPEQTIGRGANAEDDRNWDLYNAEIKRVQRAVLARVAQEVDARFPETGMTSAKKKFDQYAGCSTCPCSPGYVIEGVRADFSVTLTEVIQSAEVAV